MLELDPVTVLFQVVNFLILLAGLKYFLFRPLRNKLDERAKVSADARQSAHDHGTEAAQLRAEWQERRRMVEEEVEEMRQAAQLEANRETAKLLEVPLLILHS